jgi:hypothetical protein
VKRIVLFFLVVCGLQAETYTYWIEPCKNSEADCEAADEELAQWAMEAWQRASNGLLEFVRSPMSKARIRLYWASTRNRGFYGEARPITVNGKPGAEVDVRPNLHVLGHKVEGVGSKDRLFRHSIVYLTCLHEIGHALGLPHSRSFSDVMYSFEYGGNILDYFGRYRKLLDTREDIRGQSGLSHDDEKRLLAVYSGPKKKNGNGTTRPEPSETGTINEKH